MLGARVREIRTDHGLTQSQMAYSIGSSRPHLANIESGKSKPSSMFIKSICREFCTNEQWLVDGTGSKYCAASIIHTVNDEMAWLSSTGYISKYVHIAQGLAHSCNLDRDIWAIFNSHDFLMVLNYIISKNLEVDSTKKYMPVMVLSEFMKRFSTAFPDFDNYWRSEEREKLFEEHLSELAKNETWRDTIALGFAGVDDPSVIGLRISMELETRLLSHRIYSDKQT